tara:strand:+ start:225 stop:596 length:372 start_codon:yes stop_codon:yes gene_type:complete
MSAVHRIDGDRFLQQYVKVGLQRRGRVLVMQVMRGADDDGIDGAAGNQVVEIGVGLLDIESHGHLVELHAVTSAECHQGGIIVIDHIEPVASGGKPPSTYHAETDRRCMTHRLAFNGKRRLGA